MRFWYHWKEKIEGFQTSPESHDSDNWMAKYHVSKLAAHCNSQFFAVSLYTTQNLHSKFTF